jgi:predicted nucleotidyltransferase
MHASLWFPHESARRQSWATVDPDIGAWVESVIDAVTACVGGQQVTGAYLHGSLAMESFYRGKSDLDLLLVVERPLTPSLRRAVAVALCDASDRRPLLGDLESSVVAREDIAPFRHPARYEVHYSERWKAAIRAGEVPDDLERTDTDLAAHCAVIRTRGIRLRGEPIDEVFGAVPRAAFRASVLEDLAWILADDHICESSFYAVLNACRVMANVEDGWSELRSKDEGGEWALEHLPEAHHRIVAQALSCYRSAEPVAAEARLTDGHTWNRAALEEFREDVRARTEFPDVGERAGP